MVSQIVWNRETNPRLVAETRDWKAFWQATHMQGTIMNLQDHILT